jgi:hypothetical protein
VPLVAQLRAYPYIEDILFLVSSLFELSDGSRLYLYWLRLNVDQEVHITAGLETGATIHGALQFTDKL